MAVTFTFYNHTRARYLSGANAVGDEYRINLYSTLPANLTATTKADAEDGATQIATANGYTQDDMVIASLAVTSILTSNGKLDADDPLWTATGGSIEAAFAMLWNYTDDAPVIRYDFGGTVVATDGIPFVIGWHPDGIITQE